MGAMGQDPRRVTFPAGDDVGLLARPPTALSFPKRAKFLD
jgi:hypothetical protein